MERLTEKDWDCVSGNVFDAVRRLQEIENIMGDDYDLDRLRNAVTNAPYWMCPVCCGCPGKTENGERTELCKYPEDMKLCEERQKKLLELAEADRDGRCVVLPCKIGDAIYQIVKHRNSGEVEIIQYFVNAVETEERGGFVKSHRWRTTSTGFLSEKVPNWVKLSDFGKTVFLTRKAAESALKGETHEDPV